MEKFQESLTCPICLALLVAPVESNCSHTFCLECALTFIQKTNETTKLSCPICRSLISEMKPSGALRRIVASIGDVSNLFFVFSFVGVERVKRES